MVASLEDDIAMLRELDDIRIASATLRDKGYKTLAALVAEAAQQPEEQIKSVGYCPRYPPRPREAAQQPEERIKNDAQAILALCEHLRESPETLKPELDKSRNAVERLANYLKDLDLTAVTNCRFPILVAASAMQALIAVPGYTFSQSLPYFYYLIIRELYTADMPDWAIGGARPSHKEGMVSAFVTNSCVQALESLARVQEKTADFVAKVGEIQKRIGQLERVKDLLPEQWQQREEERLQESLHVTVRRFAYDTVLPLPKLPDCLSSGDIRTYIANIILQMRGTASNAETNFKRAVKAIGDFHESENKKAMYDEGQAKSLERARIGRDVGLAAITDAGEKAVKALEVLSAAGWEKESDNWTTIKDKLKKASEEVRDLLRPVQSFLSSVLDRELAVASGACKGQGDIAEMAFAAAAYGTVTNEWKNERLCHTVDCLSKEISDHGRFPRGRPFSATQEGTSSAPYNTGVIGALTQILRHGVVTQVEPRLVKKMLKYFEDTQAEVPVTTNEGKKEYGWCHDYIPPPRSAHPLATAIATRSLASINRMLDDQINERIFDHFSVKRLKDLENGPDLDSLFYPDYGLPLAPTPSDKSWESVAIPLQKMRAHVEGLKSEKRLHSLVLHGPPGTGKTTLVEALAKSCEVPLIEVTPSDIVVKGEAAVERRARDVFEALSLLTRVVILFDEFEPVLWRRDHDAGPSNVFAFLTPGMLPKLKRLHKQAKRRSVAYVLVTNKIGCLDEAAIREGRFDKKMGIYPPDLLSRAGGFLSEAAAFINFSEFIKKGQADGSLTDDVLQGRLREIVKETSGAGLQALVRKGWFNRLETEEKLPPEDTPLAYFLTGSEPKEWLHREAKLDKLEYNGNKKKRSRSADLEIQQWAWVLDWDELKKKSLTKVIAEPPKVPTVVKLLARLKTRSGRRTRLVAR